MVGIRRSVIISGAGSGIGKAIAQKLSLHGFDCYLLGRNAVPLQKTLISLQEGNHFILEADIRDLRSLEESAAKINRPIDAIIANAGVGGENHWGKGDRWNEIIATNLTGSYNFVNAFLPLLQSARSAYKHVVFTSSVLARLGVANYSAYCASKAGILGLMRSMAVQLAPEKILVNAICPGWVNTQMSREGIEGIANGLGISPNEFFKIAMEQVPLGKMSEPEEVADLVNYLVHQQSMTGQTLDLNNGSVMNS
jgi:NAD(P)-dependent dehydrogenase (short-subunit alcohol dehydrogenase family)